MLGEKVLVAIICSNGRGLGVGTNRALHAVFPLQMRLIF
jgi:hypothetical protein